LQQESSQLDPELMALVENWPIRTLDREGLPRARQQLRALSLARRSQLDAALLGAVQARELEVRLQSGRSARILMKRPKGRERETIAAVVNIHGGGMILGVPEQNIVADYAMAQTHGVCVLSPEYDLAPEHEYPAAIERLYEILHWLHAEAPGLGIDRTRIFVSGKSAGAGLAASLSLLARDRGDSIICGQMLVAPMLDDRTPLRDQTATEGERHIWTAEMNRFAWNAYLGGKAGKPETSYYAAAARCPDLRGLPDTYIFTGTLDLFFQENVDFAMRAAQAGANCGIFAYPRACHAFEQAHGTALHAQFQTDFDDAFQRLLSNNAKAAAR
jgi:acetyl esterase/lipase